MCVTHCNTLQHTATHCNTLQHTANQSQLHANVVCQYTQHTATRCNTLQHTCNPVTVARHSYVSIDWFWLRGWLINKGAICTGSAPLFWNIICLFERPRTRLVGKIGSQNQSIFATHCNTLQHTTTHCNTLQHTCNTITVARHSCVSISVHTIACVCSAYRG